jgi:hypothetical protein
VTMVKLLRHRQTKEAETDRFHLQKPEPALYSTRIMLYPYYDLKRSVVISKLRDEHSVIISSVNDAVLAIDAARPVARKCML